MPRGAEALRQLVRRITMSSTPAVSAAPTFQQRLALASLKEAVKKMATLGAHATFETHPQGVEGVTIRIGGDNVVVASDMEGKLATLSFGDEAEGGSDIQNAMRHFATELEAEIVRVLRRGTRKARALNKDLPDEVKRDEALKYLGRADPRRVGEALDRLVGEGRVKVTDDGLYRVDPPFKLYD
jgi:hypothetical protein